MSDTAASPSEPPFEPNAAPATEPGASPFVRASLKQLLIAFACGVTLALAFPGVDLAPLAWVALVPFCYLVFQPRRKRDMVKLFGAMGAGLYLILLYWFLAMHPLTWLGFSETTSLLTVVLCWLGASGALVLQLLVFGALYGYLSQGWRTPSWKHVLALATGWTVLEWLTSLGTFGFTWGNLALTQAPLLPVIQILALVGPFPLAGLIVAFNGAIALTLYRRSAAPFGLAAIPVVATIAYGFFALATPLPPTTFAATIVQGNIEGAAKWAKGPDAIFKMADKYIELSNTKPGGEMVLWPETALPEYLRNNPRLMARLQSEAGRQGRAMFFGTMDFELIPQDYKPFNAVAAIAPSGQLLGFDYKRHLVPYGEYLPGRAYMPGFMAGLNIVGHDVFPGTTPHIFEMPFAKVGAGVCYDGIFPDAMRPVALAGAEVLAIVTNDAWYKDTTAPHVLLAHAALRAVENHRWVLRAANTGISAIIEPTGHVTQQTGVFVDAAIAGRAAPLRDLTPYTRFGDWASQLAGLIFLGFLGLRWKNRKNSLA